MPFGPPSSIWPLPPKPQPGSTRHGFVASATSSSSLPSASSLLWQNLSALRSVFCAATRVSMAMTSRPGMANPSTLSSFCSLAKSPSCRLFLPEYLGIRSLTPAPRDNAIFTLSPRQAEAFGGWKRPQQLFGQLHAASNDIFMDPGDGCDLVQDMTTDCSVVASLCAAMRVLTGKHLVRERKPFLHSRSHN